MVASLNSHSFWAACSSQLFSEGPAVRDALFAIGDIVSIYNSSQAKLTLACQHVTTPCSVDVEARTITVSAVGTAMTAKLTSQPARAYSGTLVTVKGRPIDWHRHKKLGKTTRKVVVVAICGVILGVLVIACL